MDDEGAASKLQAVILADAVFLGNEGGSDGEKEMQNYGLQPLSREKPQILTPLNNQPLLDYIMEFLASNQVEQVILITAEDSGELETYLKGKEQLQKTSKKKSNNKKISKSKHSYFWNDYGGCLEVMLVKDSSLLNAGDALRELYKRNLVVQGSNKKDKHKPFLLIQGNVISNLNLSSAMQQHQARNQADASSLMTCVMTTRKSTSGKKSSIPSTNNLTVGLVKETAGENNSAGGNNSTTTTSSATRDYRIFCYDTSTEATSTKVPCSFLLQSQSPGKTGGLTIRDDLQDTGIYICSPDVLGKFEDEFDYLSIQADFIANSVAEEEEGLQTRIHAHVVEKSDSKNNVSSRCYASQVMDFASYHQISSDLLQRWAYPMVPDNHVVLTTSSKSNDDPENQQQQQQLYKLVVDHTARRSMTQKENDKNSSNNVTTTATTTINKYQYKECRHPTTVGRSSLTQGPGMMGSSGSIGEDCCIEKCVLGNNVEIGSNCRIHNSHIWDSVKIEDDVTIESSVIAQGAVVKKGAIVPKGCVIGEGCAIDASVVLQEFTRVTLQPDEDDDDEFDHYESGFGDDASAPKLTSNDNKEAPVNDPAVVGAEGKGHAWHPPVADVDDSDDGSDDEDDAENQTSALSKDTWIQMQSIGGDPTEYDRWYQRMQTKAALKHDQEDDGFSDDENDDGFGVEGVTESEAFSAFTDGAFTFGDGDGGGPSMVSPSSAAGASSAVVGRQKGIDVVKEMTEICMEFDDTVFPMENLSIELNSYKFSQNATYSDCTMAATLALLQKMDITPDMTDGRLVTTLKGKLESFWAALLQKMSIGVAEEVAIIHALEMAATGSTSSTDKKATASIAEKLQSGMSFRFILQTMHDEEVLSEEAVLKWAAERKQEGKSQDTPSPRVELFRMQPVQDFLEWLEEESDDEDDDSDDEDDSLM